MHRSGLPSDLRELLTPCSASRLYESSTLPSSISSFSGCQRFIFVHVRIHWCNRPLDRSWDDNPITHLYQTLPPTDLEYLRCRLCPGGRQWRAYWISRDPYNSKRTDAVGPTNRELRRFLLLLSPRYPLLPPRLFIYFFNLFIFYQHLGGKHTNAIFSTAATLSQGFSSPAESREQLCPRTSIDVANARVADGRPREDFVARKTRMEWRALVQVNASSFLTLNNPNRVTHFFHHQIYRKPFRPLLQIPMVLNHCA